MTREEKQKAIDALKISAPVMTVTQEEFNTYIQTINTIMDLLEQEPCEDAISRQAVPEYIEGSEAELGHSSENELVCQYIKELSPVKSQLKMGCDGCVHEKTGNNSTYPCSHCSRCYTDKYKTEGEK